MNISQFDEYFADGETKLLNVRFLKHKNEIHFGVKSCFDRWANSLDFILYRAPRDQDDLDLIIQAAEYAVKKGFYDVGLCKTRELQPFIRKVKSLNKEPRRRKG